MGDSIEISTPGGMKKFKASDILYTHAEVAKSGRHHQKGVLIMHGPSVRRGVNVGDCTNLDIVPTMLQILNQDIPSQLPGKTLNAGLSLPVSGTAVTQQA